MTDWRVLDGARTAWFDAPSLTVGATLAGRVLDQSIEIELRSMGVRVRVATTEQSDAVSAAALELGLSADPTALQQLSVVFESSNPAAIKEFWQQITDYAAADGTALVDPLHRDPTMHFRSSNEESPLRNRIHLDVVRPEASVEQLDAGEASGPYGVCHRDADGNEVDLVPGGPLSQSDDAADWQAVFSAMACYRVTSTTQRQELATAAAELADTVGFPLLIDLRPGLVILDSGKDQWEVDTEFTALAERIQQAARALGATADPAMPRFVQLFLDAVDVPAVRQFWLDTLGYVADPRDEVTDIFDPRRLNPVLVFQELDAADTARRGQRNRIFVELAVPLDLVPGRVATATAAGGRLIDHSDNHWQITDPEGNELLIIGS